MMCAAQIKYFVLMTIFYLDNKRRLYCNMEGQGRTYRELSYLINYSRKCPEKRKLN